MTKSWLPILSLLLFSCNPFSDTENISYTDSQGKVKVEGKKVAGKREGVWSYYLIEGGQLIEQREFKEDSLMVYREYNNGILVTLKTYKNNKLNGPYEQYYGDTGKPESIGQMKDNKMEGLWQFYNSEGKLIEKRWYENDNMVKSEDLLTKEVHEFK